MSSVNELQGITWDHVRGLGGLRAASDAFRQRRPDVKVVWSARSLQDFGAQPLEELANRFDLLMVDHPAIGAAVAAECLLPLDGSLDPAALEDQVATSVGQSARSYEWGGRRWALAADAASQVAAYRPDLLRKAGVAIPHTWDEAMTAALTLRRHGLWAALPAVPVDAMCSFLAVCTAQGEEPFTGDRVISREVGGAALALLVAFLSRSHPQSLGWNPPRLLEHMSSADDVAYCPLAFGYSNYSRPGFRPRLVKVAEPPSGPAGVAAGVLGGAGLAVSARSSHPGAAVEFAAFAAARDVQRSIYFEGGGQPGHRSAWTDQDVSAAASGFFLDTLGALEAAHLRPRHAGFLEFQDAAGHRLHDFLRNPDNPERTLALMDEAYAQSLLASGA